MPYQREAVIVLEMWREIQRQIATTIPNSPEAVDLEVAATRLRAEYQRLVALALENHRPVPPPMPETSGS